MSKESHPALLSFALFSVGLATGVTLNLRPNSPLEFGALAVGALGVVAAVAKTIYPARADQEQRQQNAAAETIKKQLITTREQLVVAEEQVSNQATIAAESTEPISAALKTASKSVESLIDSVPTLFPPSAIPAPPRVAQLTMLPAAVSWATIGFVMGYLIGLAGIITPLSSHPRTLAWKNNGNPPIASALAWLPIQEQMEKQNYDRQDIEKMYGIYSTATATANPLTVADLQKLQGLMTQDQKNTQSLGDLLKGTASH